jgi:hypothetical protein
LQWSSTRKIAEIKARVPVTISNPNLSHGL